METIDRKKLEMKELVLDQVKWFSLVLGSFTFFDTLQLQFAQEKYLLITLYGLIFISSMSMLFIKKIPANIRVTVIVIAIYGVGLLALMDEGIIGSGPLWLIAFPSVTAALLGKWKAVVAVFISFATAVVYLLTSHIPGNFPANMGIDYFTHGLDQAFDLLLLSFITSIPTASLFEKLHANLAQETRQSQDLSDAIQKLLLANNDLDAFTHTVSHDLKAPIRHISGYARLAADALENNDIEEAKESLKRIEDSSRKAGSLIEEIMRLSRLSNQEIKPESFDLSALVEGCFEYLKRDEDYSGIETKVAPGIQMHGDRELIQIAMENLISNAFKFSSKGENPQVDFGVQEIDGASVYYLQDNGVGFDPAKVQQLFEPFSRLHASREYEGFGVGLATVKKIIDKHGGRIWAESAQGKGATFYFSLLF